DAARRRSAAPDAPLAAVGPGCPALPAAGGVPAMGAALERAPDAPAGASARVPHPLVHDVVGPGRPAVAAVPRSGGRARRSQLGADRRRRVQAAARGADGVRLFADARRAAAAVPRAACVLPQPDAVVLPAAYEPADGARPRSVRGDLHPLPGSGPPDGTRRIERLVRWARARRACGLEAAPRVLQRARGAVRGGAHD